MRRELLILLVLAAGCANPRPEAKREEATPEPAPPPASEMAAMPHGDHRPHHGGIVLMDGDLHFEVVFDPAGHHRVYLSDAIRTELPASAASRVGITILRPGGAEPESLTLRIDEFGESWIADGAPVEQMDSRALVSLTYQGAPYEIELPFRSEPPDPAALDPHAAHRQ